jgi:hypothetical protein
MTTLKEFTKDYILLNTEEGQKAIWRRALPTELRQREVVTTKGGWWTGGRSTQHSHFVLEERWIRYHKGDVIDVEWREIEKEYEPGHWRVY